MRPLPALCLLFTIVLTFRGLQVQAQATDEEEEEEEHLCSRLVKRQLDRIHLKSITFSPTLQLIIYEGKHFYRITDEESSSNGVMADDHIPLPEKYELWNKNELNSASRMLLWEPHQTPPNWIYILTYTYTTWWQYDELKMVALIRLRNLEFVYSIAPTFFEAQFTGSYRADRLYDRFKPAEEYALVVGEHGTENVLYKKASLEGFVLHKDTWQNSRQYVLYDLQLDGKSSTFEVYLKRIDPDKKQKENPAPPNYYHIQRTTVADEVLLVQGGGNEEKEDPTLEKYSPTRSLFAGMDKYLPVGYRYGQKYTFLFDQMLGCVYRLEHEHGLDLSIKAKRQIRLKRTNIPYERFFRCSSEHFPVPRWDEEERLKVEQRWPADRCNRNVLKRTEHDISAIADDSTTTPSAVVEVDWKKVGAIAGSGLLLLVVAGFFLCCCRPGGRKQQQFQRGGQKKMHQRLKIANASSSAASTASSNAASSNSSVAFNRERKKSPWVKKMMMIKEGGKKGRKGGGRR